MYSFIDENESFVAEAKNEAFGYVPNSLKLDSFVSNINISLFKALSSIIHLCYPFIPRTEPCQYLYLAFIYIT